MVSMSSVINQLFDFINTAEKNRKYPQGTALGRRAALKLFEAELNEGEKESLGTLKANLEQIYQNVFNKNKSKMNAESLVTYKKRLEKLIEDYEAYGIDPTKLANWNRATRKVRINTTQSNNQKVKEQIPNSSSASGKEIELSRFELPLRPNVKAIIIVPSDIKKSEVEKVRKYIEFLESISNPDSEEGIR